MKHCVHIIQDTERKRPELFSGTPAKGPVDNLVEALDESFASLAKVVDSLFAVAVECLTKPPHLYPNI